MTLPGFTAESSLKASLRPSMIAYTGRLRADGSSGEVVPALFRLPCRLCPTICEGDFIGACLPWCFCTCRGGTHCGVPS